MQRASCLRHGERSLSGTHTAYFRCSIANPRDLIYDQIGYCDSGCTSYAGGVSQTPLAGLPHQCSSVATHEIRLSTKQYTRVYDWTSTHCVRLCPLAYSHAVSIARYAARFAARVCTIWARVCILILGCGGTSTKAGGPLSYGLDGPRWLPQAISLGRSEFGKKELVMIHVEEAHQRLNGICIETPHLILCISRKCTWRNACFLGDIVVSPLSFCFPLMHGNQFRESANQSHVPPRSYCLVTSRLKYTLFKAHLSMFFTYMSSNSFDLPIDNFSRCAKIKLRNNNVRQHERKATT